MDEITIRVVADDADLSRWVRLHNEISPCWQTDGETEGHAQRVSPLCTHALGECRGDGVSALRIERDPWTPNAHLATVTVGVVPAVRRRGVGSAMVSWAEQWATERGLRGLDVWFDEASAGALQYWTHRGYLEVGRERVSVRTTVVDPPVVSLPGIEIIAFAGRQELIDGMHRVQSTAIGDVPGPGTYAGQGRDEWVASELMAPGFSQEASTVALAGDEVVGFALLRRRPGQPTIADHEMTAVGRGWRGRGVARALKCAQIPLARAAGIEMLVAMNEERNAAILRVNEGLGYRRETAWVQYRRPDDDDAL